MPTLVCGNQITIVGDAIPGKLTRYERYRRLLGQKLGHVRISRKTERDPKPLIHTTF